MKMWNGECGVRNIKMAILLIAVVVTLFLLTGCSSTPKGSEDNLTQKEIEEMLLRCHVKQMAGDYKGAIAEYDTLLSKPLEDDVAENVYACRGSSKEGIGDLEGAIADYSRAIEINANYVLLYIYRGGARYKSGDYEGAVADWQKVIEMDASYKGGYQPLIDEAKANIKGR